MKTVFASLFLLLTAGLVLRAQTAAPAKKPFELYAEFVEDTRVDLSDGAVWMMDKGDCFPIYMFKDLQTKVVLKIASSTFQVDAKTVKVLPEAENERALVSYRKNLAEYLNKQPDIWKSQAKKEKADAKADAKDNKEKDKDKDKTASNGKK